jgi:hypothetical protein
VGGNNRYKGRWDLPPITLGDLRPAAIPVIVRCPTCKRSATLAATDLPLPDTADMTTVANRLRCEGCGRRGGMSAAPSMEPWIRYLRETGQTDRLPWCSAFFSAT